MIRLICTDFDGTIYDSSAAIAIVPAFSRWIQEAQERGAKWVISTGRELADVADKIHLMQKDVLPDFIVSIERHIHQRRNGEYHDHARWNSACHADHQALFAGAGEALHRVREWVAAHCCDAELYDDEWSPLCIVATHPADADAIHHCAERECRGVPGLSVVRNTHYFRFGHSGYSKGTALGEIARLLGVGREDVFAAGDHYNDLSMLDGTYAKYVAAPANAIPEVKAVVSRAGGCLAERPCSLGILDALIFFDAPTR